jgi:hypothetical protein
MFWGSLLLLLLLASLLLLSSPVLASSPCYPANSLRLRLAPLQSCDLGFLVAATVLIRSQLCLVRRKTEGVGGFFGRFEEGYTYDTSPNFLNFFFIPSFIHSSNLLHAVSSVSALAGV